jgi:phage major head subunit gpT-like protein
MNVTADLLAALTTNYRVIFQKALSENAASLEQWKKIATIFNSVTDKETYSWLGEHPSMEEWKDKRNVRALRPFDYTLTNKHYEATIGIDRDTIEDDKYNLFAPRIQGLARAALKHMNEVIFSQLDGGAALKGYDTSYYFFADTRVIGESANIDNLLSGAYSGSSAEIRAALALAVQNMMAFQDDYGKPMHLIPDTIVCAPKMYIPIKEALRPDYAGAMRPEAEFVKDIIVSPWVDGDADDWYMLCTTGEVKPVIFQLRKAPEFAEMSNPKDFVVFMQKLFLYGVDARYEVGFGDPRTAIKVVDV